MEVNDHTEQVKNVSGVRGRKVYELTPRRQLVIGLGNSLDNTIQQRFVSPTSPYRIRAHNAELHVVAAGGYELLIPASGTEPAVRVPIEFYARATPMSGGIHGVEQGPAQYKLTRDSSGWRAQIEINETLHRRDVPFTIGHELDEIALIVRTNPADDAVILAEAEASLFKPSSTSSKITAHDRAAARELGTVWQDLQQPPSGTTASGITKRQKRLERMLDAMGLLESTHIFDKLRVLRSEGATDILLRRIGVPGERVRYLTSPQFRVLQAMLPTLKSSGSMVDQKLISHLMIPADPGRRLFRQAGISGGHHDKLLGEFVNNHPQIIIVKEAQKEARGIIYRQYSQYRWQGSGPKPMPHDSRFPTAGDAAAGTYDSDWMLAKQKGAPLPKTTFSSLQDFLPGVDEAWLGWYGANSVLAPLGVTNQFTYFSTLVDIQVTGFFDYIPPDHFLVTTAFVEASWF
ncbi:MAG: hypothetical protein ACPGWR_14915 [Ardenticatenaceae bacterium]